ncbi:Aste57867_16110 [Aphanomyces stellatus]|uniref:Aste57867_16110 protein n=1 Tax=Aphanomyces stellatus TaxID=120398 RepID=A0A485L5P4_9STRA|nr:hypothetical protein As57867_016054 [Aphanomyces stellatus]VFT92893.1 Aste57867_16110 [Aphanomyces stellatus]
MSWFSNRIAVQPIGPASATVQTLRRVHFSFDRVYPVVSRTLAFLSALAVLFCEIVASNTNKQFLMGTTTKVAFNSNYNSYLMPSFLASIVSKPSAIQRMLTTLSINTTTPFVAYLDTTTSGPSALQPNSCNPPTLNTDYLYDISYVQPLLRHALAHVHGLGWIDNAFVLVDCSFKGRALGDTTITKFYLVDKTLTNFSTFVTQTLSIRRPAKGLLTSGGVAMLSTTPIASMDVDPMTGFVTSNASATYDITIGFTFPFDWQPFERIALDAVVPPTGQWDATVVGTGERFSLAGTTGIYRGSPTVQAGFDYYYWALPDNPIAFVAAIEYTNVNVRKDVFGWVRCFLGLGIGFNIAINTLASLVVAVNMWRDLRVVWVPDVYPAMQRRALLRAVLLVLECVGNDWWYPYLYALGQGGYRLQFGGTLIFHELPRVDGLLLCLAVSFAAAWLFQLRLKLFIVVAIYFLCFSLRMWIVNKFGVCTTRANEIVLDAFLANVLPGNGGMDLWTFHEDYVVHFDLIANELTWLWVAMGLSLVYATCLKLVFVWSKWTTTTTRRHDLTTPLKSKRVTPWRHVIVPETIVTKARHASSDQTRSFLYDPLTATDDEDTQIERSAGRTLHNMIGFVASTEDYAIMDGTQRMVMTPSGVWLLGFVIVNRRLVVSINDYFPLVLNTLTQMALFRIYGFDLKDNVVATHKHKIAPHEVQRSELIRLSLQNLA